MELRTHRHLPDPQGKQLDPVSEDISIQKIIPCNYKTEWLKLNHENAFKSHSSESITSFSPFWITVYSSGHLKMSFSSLILQIHIFISTQMLCPCSQLRDSLLQNFFSILMEQKKCCTQNPFGQLQVSQFCTAAHFPLCRKGQPGQPGVGFILLCPAVMYARKSWLCMAIKHPIVYIKTCKVEA